MDVLSSFGVDGSELCESAAQAAEFPDTVPGRVAQIDADFLAYQVSYEKEDDPKSLDQIIDHCDKAIDNLRRLSAAETAVLHLTPKESNKGKRAELAVLAEYQSTRRGDKPRYLHVIRDYMGDLNTGVLKGELHYHAEADDGMAAAQYAAIGRGEYDKSIIVTRDKDLRMVPGLHLDWGTGMITGLPEDETFGYIEYDKAKSKVVGYGTKFFWAQMLMGDTVDTILGLPEIAPEHCVKYLPTQAYLKAKDKEKALAKVKPKKCGAKAAYDLLDGIDNDYDARALIVELYKANEYTHWETGKAIAYEHAILSNAILLWMRKDPHNTHDVVDFFKGIKKP